MGGVDRWNVRNGYRGLGNFQEGDVGRPCGRVVDLASEGDLGGLRWRVRIGPRHRNTSPDGSNGHRPQEQARGPEPCRSRFPLWHAPRAVREDNRVFDDDAQHGDAAQLVDRGSTSDTRSTYVRARCRGPGAILMLLRLTSAQCSESAEASRHPDLVPVARRGISSGNHGSIVSNRPTGSDHRYRPPSSPCQGRGSPRSRE